MNVLWVVFTILGLGIFGFMPATVALFSVMRRWMTGKEITHLFTYFSEIYRKEFIKANKLGFFFSIAGSILLFDLFFLPANSTFFLFIRSIIILISILYLILLLYIFPVYAHYQMNNKAYVKAAFMVGAAFPHLTGILAASLMGLYFFFTHFPGVIPFFGASLIAYVIIFQAMHVFSKLEKQPRLFKFSN